MSAVRQKNSSCQTGNLASPREDLWWRPITPLREKDQDVPSARLDDDQQNAAGDRIKATLAGALTTAQPFGETRTKTPDCLR